MGGKDHRIWKIRRIGEHEYEGRADDIIGVARGVQYGNASNWSYDMALKIGGRRWQVSFDDWMFLQGDEVATNRAHVRKWGFSISEVSLFFTKPPSAATTRRINSKHGPGKTQSPSSLFIPLIVRLSLCKTLK